MTAFQRIVVPVDFSEHSSRALDVAIELAKKFDGRLHLVHAYAIHPMLLTPYGVNIPVDFEREFRQAADLQMTACADRVRKAGLAVEVTTTADLPSDAIVRCAEKTGADLIVMGTRGLTGLKHVVLGSVAERTLRLAPCPVLTVKAS
ncbi:MAG TPA: universal stress protein [Myxococcota bacterium]|nr:universal stress protein [Myxococcota bacterium]